MRTKVFKNEKLIQINKMDSYETEYIEHIPKDNPYRKGKIYKIVCNETGKVYIGSTCLPICRRLTIHRCAYKQYLKENYRYMTSFEILEKNNFNIILIENYPCESKEKLHARERYWIENSECVNKVIPGRTHKEYRMANKEKKKAKSKAYREANKEIIKVKNKAYREANKEKINKQGKAYHEANKVKRNKQSKAYYNANKEKIRARESEKVNCSCGSTVNRLGISQHKKTKKHMKLMESQIE